MFSMIISNKEYKVRFGTNSFIDTDLIDRTKQMIVLLKEQGVFDDEEDKGSIEVTTDDDLIEVILKNLDTYKDILVLTRDLLQTGFARYNPVENILEVGNLIDDYCDETGNNVMYLFGLIANELVARGFLGDQASQEKAIPTQEIPKEVPMETPMAIPQEQVQAEVVQMPTMDATPTT